MRQINIENYLKKTKEVYIQRRMRCETELVKIIKKRLMNFIFDESTFKEKIERPLDKIIRREIDLYSAASEILGKILK